MTSNNDSLKGLLFEKLWTCEKLFESFQNHLTDTEVGRSFCSSIHSILPTDKPAMTVSHGGDGCSSECKERPNWGVAAKWLSRPILTTGTLALKSKIVMAHLVEAHTDEWKRFQKCSSKFDNQKEIWQAEHRKNSSLPGWLKQTFRLARCLNVHSY